MLHYGLNFTIGFQIDNMPGPSLILSFIIATLFGAGFHLILGGDVRRLALFLLAGWLGFGLGHGIGVLFEIDFLKIGALRIVTAAIGAILALAAAHMLTAGQTRRRRSR